MTRKRIKINKDWSALIACNYVEDIVMVSLFFKNEHVIRFNYDCRWYDFTNIVIESIVEVFRDVFNVEVKNENLFWYLNSFEKVAPITDSTRVSNGVVWYDANHKAKLIMSDSKEVQYGA